MFRLSQNAKKWSDTNSTRQKDRGTLVVRIEVKVSRRPLQRDRCAAWSNAQRSLERGIAETHNEFEIVFERRVDH